MTGERQHSLKGDRPLGAGDRDALGFREVAKRLAISLVDRAVEDGLVVGLEGAWGSGKSSLLNLIEEELRSLPEDHRSAVIHFQPWLIGQRDALIRSLFAELATQIDQIAYNSGDATGVSIARAKEAGAALRRFVAKLSLAGSAIEVAGDVAGIGLIKWFGKGTKAAGEWAHKQPESPQLSDLKGQLAKSLRDLGHRFVVTIDDVDRLEPSEAIEIMRLVRSVVDLPNIVYLLCYDSAILAHSVEQAAQVEDGRSYLEKIVQLTVMVPKPEPFQLRQWFSDELHQIASVKNEAELSRLKQVIDLEGGRQLRTPRAVMRALDAIRFFWPPLRDAEIDLADLVWIQLIKNGNPSLYRWIEEYSATMAVVSFGIVRVDEAEENREYAKLLKFLPEGHFDDAAYRYEFADHLPGFRADYSSDKSRFKLFQHVQDNDRDAAIKQRRLSSPDHYRMYFALSEPSHALTRDNYKSAFIAAENGADQTGTALLGFHRESAFDSLSKADILLLRISEGASAALTEKQCESFLLALSNVMDDAFWERPFDQNWVNSIWDRAQKTVRPLLAKTSSDARPSILEKMFKDGKAIGWLTSLLRDETFAQGRFGERKQPEDQWMFTSREFDFIAEIMISRYRSMDAKDVLATPSPINVLFAWMQAGDADGPRELVQANIVSNDGLVETLEALASVAYTDSGKYSVIKKENIGYLMDYDIAKERIDNLRQDKFLGARAEALAMAFNADERRR